MQKNVDLSHNKQAYELSSEVLIGMWIWTIVDDDCVQDGQKFDEIVVEWISGLVFEANLEIKSVFLKMMFKNVGWIDRYKERLLQCKRYEEGRFI